MGSRLIFFGTCLALASMHLGCGPATPAPQEETAVSEEELRRQAVEKRRRREQPITDGGLTLTLTPVPARVLVGGHVAFQAQLFNGSTRPVKVLRCRAGSNASIRAFREPLQAWGPDHRRIPMLLVRCGSIGEAAFDDIVALPPGATFELFEGGIHPLVGQCIPTDAVGLYQVKLTYDTTGVAEATPVKVTSNLAEFEVVAAD